MTNIVKIGIQGEMKDINIDITSIDLDKLSDLCDTKGLDNIRLLFKWVYDKYNIMVYGWLEGKIQNKHTLPNNGEDILFNGMIDSEDTKVYGDIIILNLSVIK